jgi:hypothetical protein
MNPLTNDRSRLQRSLEPQDDARSVSFETTQSEPQGSGNDPLLTPEQVARRLSVSVDWVWDHSSRKTPMLPAIRIGEGPGRGGILRYRASKIEDFIDEQERLTNAGRNKRRVQ